MNIGEVSSSVNSYQGQGSSVNAAPVTSVKIEGKSTKDALMKEPKPVDVESKKIEAAKEQENDQNSAQQATSSLKEAVEKINSAQGNAEAIFGIHEGTNRVMIKMVDKETHKVIKEFPAEETLDLIAKAWELAGIMVDEKR